MRAVLTVFFEKEASLGTPPEVKVVTGANEENFLDALKLALMEFPLSGRRVASHSVTFLPEKQ